VAKTSCANGKTVKREGNMPNASMTGKVAKIHNGGNAAKVAKVMRTMGGVVRATSANYGSHHSKATQQTLTGLGGFAAGDKD
jgi:hypothetical protein